MLFRSSIEKENANTPLGLQFWMTPNSSIIIISVDKHGLFAGRLKVGMHVEKVNDRFVGNHQGLGAIVTVTDLQYYLAQLLGRVTIWASDGSAQQQQRLLQSGDARLWKTSKSQQYMIMMDAQRPSLVEDSDMSCSDYSNSTDGEYDGDDEPSLHYCDGNMIMDEEFVEALLHRYSV